MSLCIVFCNWFMVYVVLCVPCGCCCCGVSSVCLSVSGRLGQLCTCSMCTVLRCMSGAGFVIVPYLGVYRQR
jgi:hypothetical protein